MARIEINPERYQQFLDAFLHLGPRFAAVARRVGCADETARRAWSRGWPGVDYAPPICRVYERAQAHRRAEQGLPPVSERAPVDTVCINSDEGAPGQMACMAQSVSQKVQSYQELVHSNALDAVKNEVDILQSFRASIIGGLGAANAVMPALTKLATSVAQSIELSALNNTTMRPSQLLQPMEKFARIIALLAQSTKSVIEMQRLVLGAPTSIIEQRQGNTSPDAGQASQRLGELAATIDIMRRHGLLEFDSDGNPVQPNPTHYDGEESDAKPEPVAKDDDIPF